MPKNRSVKKASERAVRGGGNERALETTPYQVQTGQLNVRYTRPGGIQTNTGADWFGPLNPMPPTAPPDVSGRRFDFPSGYNLNIQPKAYEPVGFGTLRAFADAYDLLRLVIETRKDQISRLKWNIKPRDPKKPVEGDIADRIKRVEEFFLRPDKVNFWDAWLRQLLEDLFVLDAPTLHVRRTRGGELYALEQIDGATIKRVIDDWARTPEPPLAAYQQVLKGFPAVDYMAHSALSRKVWKPNGPQELIYRPRNLRVNKVYGYSPVEQILMTINIGLRREVFQLNYFTEGTIPEALIGVPETWTPDQIRQFQDWFDSILQGNLAERRRARFVPSAVAKTYIETKQGELFGKAEEWLIRVICFAFSISPQPFVAQMNRATAQVADEIAEKEGLAPLQNWVKGLIDSIIVDEFEMADLEFAWEDDSEVDPKKEEEILTSYAGKGIMVINEARARLGLDPYPEDMFNKPMVMTSVGYVPINPDDVAGTVQPVVTNAPKAKGSNQVQEESSGDGGEEEGAKKTAAPSDLRKADDILPLSLDRPKVARIEVKLSKAVKKKLRKLGADVASQLEEKLSSLTKADEDEPDIDDLIGGLDLEVIKELEDALVENTTAMAVDAGKIALGQAGVEATPDLVNQVNRRAADWAQERAAALISLDGDLSLQRTTRDMIRSLIANGLREGLTSEEIADLIQTAYPFSPDRADLIAMTEVATANSHGALAGYRTAQDNGVSVKKEWLDLEGACGICSGNAQAGPIELDEPFPSGHEAPAAHPECRCVISPVVED